MRNIIVLWLFVVIAGSHTKAQSVMTPEGLWQLGRVSAVGLTPDGQQLIYRVSTPVISENSSRVKMYTVSAGGGPAREITTADGLLPDKHLSPDGKHRISVKEFFNWLEETL